MKLEDNNKCFACGKDNPKGLQLDFYEEEGTYKTKFRPATTYQGYPGILHGGITSTLLDEVMGRYLCHLNIPALTAQLDIRFKKTVELGQELLVEGKIVNNKGRVVEMQAQILLEDGSVGATAKGKFMKIKLD